MVMGGLRARPHDWRSPVIDLPGSVADSLGGSQSGDRLLVSAWYAGRVTIPDVPIDSWRIVDDATRQIRRELTVSARDPDGDLVPLDYGDPLATAGQRLAVTYVAQSGEQVGWGDFVIRTTHPGISWVRSEHEGQMRLVCGGATISVTAVDLTRNLRRADLLAPESPAPDGTYESEIRRLCDGIIPVVIEPGVDASGKVNAGTIYDKGDGSRINAVEDLAAGVSGKLQMGNDAALHVVPVNTTPVWDIAPGEGGVLIDADYEMDIEALYNAAISTSSGGTEEITGQAFERTGTLRWDGPLGRSPIFHDSPLITTQQAADADAATILANRVRGRAIPLTVTCLHHPGLESGDWVTLSLPTTRGILPIATEVTSIERRGTTAGILPMTLGVSMGLDDLRRALQ